MNLDSEDLVKQFAQDWPDEFERSRLRLLVTRLSEENAELHAENAELRAQQSFTGTASPRPYVLPTDGDGRG